MADHRKRERKFIFYKITFI